MLISAPRFSARIYRRDRLFFPVVAVVGLVLLALQSFSGAWVAEFEGHPDESAQFVSGRMLWEYLTTLPHENPISWAEQYYLHYPKVAIGHWPPGYHVAEALWSLVFGSSRISAMWLQWLLGLASLTCLYALAMSRFPFAIAAGIVAFTMATPVFQQGIEMTMSDIGSLLCGILFSYALLRVLRSPDRVSAGLLIVAFLAAVMVKATALCLIPAPAFALMASRKLPARAVIVTALGIFALCAALAFCFPAIRYWGGMTGTLHWQVRELGDLAGLGFLALAALGLVRDPLAIVSASMIASVVFVSYFVRSMTEPRHWIIVLPSILLLAGYGLTRFSYKVAALLLVPALWLFPWSWFRQTSSGYGELIRQLHLPARMLVSSGVPVVGEGGWIAETSLAERYPASLVVRASKVLWKADWSGFNYWEVVRTPGDVVKILDELAIDVVILVGPREPKPPYHALLRLAVSDEARWRSCGSARNLAAYCRAAPPVYPRRPLILDSHGWHIEEKIPAGGR